MLRVKKWLLGGLVIGTLGGNVLMIEIFSTSNVAAVERGPDDHWRYFDGHWSYWHAGDNRWYYTDGLHGYYHSPAGWAIYEFDKLFGVNGFHHGEYRVPAERGKIVVPRHEIFAHR